MKKTLSIVLVFVLLLSAFVLASCKGTNDKDAQNTAPPHSAASETAAPTDTPAAAPETEAPTADPNPRPDPVTVEWLAGEMQRRYYVGCMNFELMDFSDIMDRNEDTDLFFWDNQLEIDRMMLDLKDNYINVTVEETAIKNIVNETETAITADVYVYTSHPSSDQPLSGIGMSFRITVDKERMVIIAYSEPDLCATLYNDWLSWLASNYKEGRSARKEAKKRHMKSFIQYIYKKQPHLGKPLRADQSCVRP